MLSTVWMSVTHRASINNLPDKRRSSAGRTVHEGHGNRNDTDEVLRTDNGSSQSHLLCPVLLLLFITEIILLLTLLYFTLLYSTGFHWVFPLYWRAFQRFVTPSPNTLVFVSFSLFILRFSSTLANGLFDHFFFMIAIQSRFSLAFARVLRGTA